MKTFNINWATPILISLSVWLGFTDRVPWWTIILIFMSQIKFETKYKRTIKK